MPEKVFLSPGFVIESVDISPPYPLSYKQITNNNFKPNIGLIKHLNHKTFINIGINEYINNLFTSNIGLQEDINNVLFTNIGILSNTYSLFFINITGAFWEEIQAEKFIYENLNEVYYIDAFLSPNFVIKIKNAKTKEEGGTLEWEDK